MSFRRYTYTKWPYTDDPNGPNAHYFVRKVPCLLQDLEYQIGDHTITGSHEVSKVCSATIQLSCGCKARFWPTHFHSRVISTSELRKREAMVTESKLRKPTKMEDWTEITSGTLQTTTEEVQPESSIKTESRTASPSQSFEETLTPQTSVS